MEIKPEMKVLVVDDMKVMRKLVSKTLAELKLTNIVQAEDGKQAWDIINQCKKDGTPIEFVVSDWNMPNMTGLELLQKIRSTPEFKKLPFLMVTAEGEKENVVKAVTAGVSNFIVKPFTSEALCAKVDVIFKNIKAAA